MKNKKRKRNGGFTLVELLATLAILSIVVSIGVGTITGVINRTNENAYETAKNNVVATAKNYIIENGSLFRWFDGTSKECKDATVCQYQCVNIKNLIDSGYFDNDILESNISKKDKLENGDVVFLQRDKTTKTITHQIFDDGTQGTACADSDVIGRIIFDVSGSWSQEKQVTITYIANTQNTSGYRYSYSYSGNGDSRKSESGNFSSSNVLEVTTGVLTSAGTLTATLTDESGETFSKQLKITRIDRSRPEALIVSNHRFTDRQEMTITVSDTGSGVVGYYFGTKDTSDGDNVFDFNFIPIDIPDKTKPYSFTVTASDPDASYWYVHVVDAADNYSDPNYPAYVSLYNWQFKVGNPDDVPADLTIIPSHIKDTTRSTHDISGVKTSYNNYSIIEWYTNKNLSESSKVKDIKKAVFQSSTKPLYAKVVKNTIEDATVTISRSGNTLTANVKDIKLNAGTISDITYNYKWYLSNGTFISQTTSTEPNSTYNYPSDYDGKSIYVEVELSKTNYENLSIKSSNITLPKGTGWVNFSPTSTKVVASSSYNLSINVEHHGGTLSVSSPVIPTKIVGNTVYLNIAANSLKQGITYNIIITSSATDSKNSKSKIYQVIVAKGGSVEIIK